MAAAAGTQRPDETEQAIRLLNGFAAQDRGPVALVSSVLPSGGRPHLRLAVPCGSREETLAVIEEQARAELAHQRARRTSVRFGGPLAPPRS